MKTLTPILLALLLAGCQTTGSTLRTSEKSAICRALIGPIKYNSLDPQSKRFAAALLAMDLKQRNQVGEGLRCPAYR